jgi:acyl-CoA synthetase (AMP-forming)/AMP-acid ligase II
VLDIGAERVPDIGGPSVEDLRRRWTQWGVRPGDPVILALPSGIGLLREFFGVLAASGVPAVVASNTPSARLRELVGTMGARAVAAVRLPEGFRPEEKLATTDGLQVGVVRPPPHPAAAAGEVVLLTSGTSGFSSGCVFGLESLLLNAARHADAVGQRVDDVVMINLPLHFSFALVAQALATLVRGGRLVLAGPPFHPARYSAAVARHGVTVSSLTPVLARSLLATTGPLPPGLRVLTVGGDTLGTKHVAQLLERRPGGELYLTYGLTQAGPRVLTLAAHREPPERLASVGKPLAGTRVTLEDLGDGSGMKQLLVASDTLMRRRIGVVEGRRLDDWWAPGVIATGDIFEQDADGYLYFKGRLADFIVRGDEKICLSAVRRVSCQMPDVVRAATSVVRNGEGVDFDLVLDVQPGCLLSAVDYRKLLSRLVRRNELPREIRIVQDTGRRRAYK